MTAYSATLVIHVTLVLASGSFFFLRGIWMLQESPLLQIKPVRILPHIVDTFLLVSGFYLAYLINMYPGTTDWLTTKLVLLLAYIVLGMFALKRGKTRTIRATAFAMALSVYGYMITVALTKNVLGYFA